VSENIIGSLKKLAISIREIIEQAKTKGEVEFENELNFHWKVDNFRYTDNGITDSRAHGDYITKQTWFRASTRILEQVKQNSVYTSTLEQLRKEFGTGEEYAGYLERFADKVIYACFYAHGNIDEQIDSIIANFMRNLKGEPVRYGSEVELDGIVLRPETIEPAFGVTLRQPKIEDLEVDKPAYVPDLRGPFLPHPSGYLRIEFLGRGAREVQLRIYQAITILRLFRVGSVKYESYRMYSDSVTDQMAGGTATTGSRESALEKYLLTSDDEPILKKFWEAIVNVLPSSLYEFEQTAPDHVAIAYTRYSDALLQNGLMERRIANAIMGMESLYLKGGETQELVYRLCLRAGKLLRILGFDHHDVKKHIADSYRIRNLFAHGSQLSYKERRKLDLKYKDPKNLLLTVLDYLRVSIISAIFLRKAKDELIDILDDSLIDDQKQELLNSWLSYAKSVLK
jgi:hypothetical protein